MLFRSFRLALRTPDSPVNGQMRIPDHEGILKVKTGVVITGKGSTMKKA